MRQVHIDEDNKQEERTVNTGDEVVRQMARFKAQLRQMSKNDLIRSYCAQYAQTVRYSVLVNQLRTELEALKPQTKADEKAEQGETGV